MANNPELKKPSAASVFAAMTLNLGPQTTCWPHRDQLNLIFGICLDWVLGRFNPARGGHLILHEARRILQLGPGRIVLFPSAAMTHESTPVADNELRFSVTGYVAGGFWRFVAQRFKLASEWARLFPAEAAKHKAEGPKRWEDGCRMFKTMEELYAIWSQVRQIQYRQACTPLIRYLTTERHLHQHPQSNRVD